MMDSMSTIAEAPAVREWLGRLNDQQLAVLGEIVENDPRLPSISTPTPMVRRRFRTASNFEVDSTYSANSKWIVREHWASER